jgi:hypothetical protein
MAASLLIASATDQPASRLWERTERACLALVEAELDLAFSFLRLANTEFTRGNRAHATDLISTAVATHHRTLEYLGNVPAGLEEQKYELSNGVRRLFDAIRAEWRRSQSS